MAERWRRRLRHLRLRAEARVRRGSRTVLWTQPTAQFGNLMYEWMHAFNARAAGHDVVCLRTPAADPWLPVLGDRLAGLLVDRADVRHLDRRERGLHHEFGVTFTAADLAAFDAGFVTPSGLVDPDRVPPAHRLGHRDVLVNVRRGDYFTSAANRRNYAFDLDAYLGAALEASERVGGPIERVHVVSDGIDWCRAHLGWLTDRVGRVTFADDGQPPAVHLAILANAPRLVLANSTFSYWGGYLSTLRSGRPEQVVAPWFHIRSDRGGAAWHLDPRWSIVRDVPGDWALPAVVDDPADAAGEGR